MKSHRSVFIVMFVALAACIGVTDAVGQRIQDETWGCPAKDYKCQLDNRMKALQANPRDPENYYNIGIVFQRSGACKEAIESFSMYIAIPDLKPELRADGYNNRGICHRRLKKPDLAYEDHTQAIELNGKAPAFFVNRANSAIEMLEVEAGLADYGRALALDPKYALAYSNRANYYLSQNKNDLALSDLNKAIDFDPTNPEPFYMRAMVFRRKADFAKAVLDLDKYIALGPDNPRYLADGYLNRAIAHASLNKLDQAVKDASKAIELAPTYYDAYMVRALVYRQLKKDDLASADEAAAAKLRKQ